MDIDDPLLRGDRRGDRLQAYLSRAGETRRLEAELVSLSPRAATCGFEPGAPLVFAMGDPVTLWLVQPSSGLDHALPARLVRRSDQPARTVLGLELTDPDALSAVLHPSLAHAFNRRAAIRVPATGEVMLIPPREAGAPLAVGELRDLSVGGLAADVPETFEAAMAGRVAAECLFRLPASAEEPQLSVAVSIRHRSLLPDGRIRYGVRFADTEDGRLEAVQSAIAAWLASRTER